ncbi:MAG: GGDEF domain-containing protein [Woeseiaceae bacterium]|nr:GGDEF domain-containing protein [Woeseiaceae bacterium]
MNARISSRRATLYGALAALTIFLFDLVYPLGVVGSMPYVALPLLGLLARARRAIFTLAILGTVLTFAGLFLSTAGAPLYVVLINRGLNAAMVWTVALMAVRHLAIGDSLRESLEKQASHDPLTDLYNRRYVFSMIENGLSRYQRYGDIFSLILIDADYFKQVNDQYGHCAGDAALQHIAATCVQSVRDADVVGRFGGEEFIILLPHTDATEAAVVAERIRGSMHESAFQWQDRPVEITLSLGVAEVSSETKSFDQLIKAADRALYAAKREGRDQVAIADSVTQQIKFCRAA